MESKQSNWLRLGLLSAAVLFFASCSQPQPPTSAPAPSRLSSLSVFPAEVDLTAKARTHRVLITGLHTNGFELDLTGLAVFRSDKPAVVAVEPGGLIRGLKEGTAAVTARVEQKSVSFKVTVEPAVERQLSFVADVLPVLSKTGCNAGSCHAKPEGQNGFKLSVFAYDPKSDYANIVKHDRGRRVFPALPEESLLLKKPTMAVEHQGGQRFERDSEEYATIHKWIAQGMAYSQPDDATLRDISVHPTERRYQKSATQRLLVLATFSDDTVRDVTHLADFVSNDKEIAKVDDAGQVTVGSVSGEGAIIARFMGLVGISRVTVPADKSLPASLYAALPVNNGIDRLVHAHLQRLGLAPSELCTDSEFLRRASLDAIGRLPTVEEAKRFLADCGSLPQVEVGIPPHPDPLPPGEGTAACASRGAKRVRSVPALTAFLPRPAREGRGEGERQSSPMDSTDLLP